MSELLHLNNYHVDHLIAEGGTARVYWGINRLSGFPVAIKELKVRHLSNPILRKNFKEMETQLMLYAQHPNIPRLVEFIDMPERNQMILVMEYVKGRTLENYIYHEIGLIPEKKALPMFLEILDTVAFLHNARIPHLRIFDGVLHLDIKSNNIMLQPDGKVKLIDLGLASRLSDGGMSTGYGTPAYMPPEQWERRRCTKATDVFALGVLLFEMLTGHLPYTSNSRDREEIKNKIMHDPIPQMQAYYPMVGGELQVIVERATMKQPFARYQTCEEFARCIKEYMLKHRI